MDIVNINMRRLALSLESSLFELQESFLFCEEVL